MRTLIVDDDADLRAMLQQAFEIEGLPVEVCTSPIDALKRIEESFEGVVVTDVRMPKMNGLELLQRIHQIDAEIPVIVMTGHGDVPMVIEAMKSGVFDFIPKPFSAEHLIASVRRAGELWSLVIENRRLRASASIADHDELLIGETTVMVHLRDTLRQLAQADVDVLLEGETGTGKELAAIVLHRWGSRSRKPLITVNCAALPQSLAEPELFGYEAGASAQHKWGKAGRIEASSGGTLFFDETGSMPLTVQGALLRVVEQREVFRIGADQARPLNLRIVAATNVDLGAAAGKGAFREDLYYRLNTIRLRLPPLRERTADIPILFTHFLQEASQRLRVNMSQLPRAVHTHLYTHHWPGNVRELKNYAQSVLLGLNTAGQAMHAEGLDLASQVASFEAATIKQSLEQNAGDVLQVQAALGLARNTLYDKLKRYNIRPSDFRRR